jgi:hypothetical protein
MVQDVTNCIEIERHLPEAGNRALEDYENLVERIAVLGTDDAIVRHGILDDNVSFIQKPFSADSLLSKAREVLDQQVN